MAMHLIQSISGNGIIRSTESAVAFIRTVYRSLWLTSQLREAKRNALKTCLHFQRRKNQLLDHSVFTWKPSNVQNRVLFEIIQNSTSTFFGLNVYILAWRERVEEGESCVYQCKPSCNAFHLRPPNISASCKCSAHARANCLTIDRLILRSSSRAIKRANLIHELGLELIDQITFSGKILCYEVEIFGISTIVDIIGSLNFTLTH